MAEKKTTTSPLPQEKNGDWKHGFVLDARQIACATVAGGVGGFLFKNHAARWASLAFGAGLGVGLGYTEGYGSSAKSATRASPDGEN